MEFFILLAVILIAIAFSAISSYLAFHAERRARRVEQALSNLLTYIEQSPDDQVIMDEFIRLKQRGNWSAEIIPPPIKH